MESALNHIAKSASDRKEYRLVRLSNGIEAILVSTKRLQEAMGNLSTAKAAAAMAVQV